MNHKCSTSWLTKWIPKFLKSDTLILNYLLANWRIMNHSPICTSTTAPHHMNTYQKSKNSNNLNITVPKSWLLSQHKALSKKCIHRQLLSASSSHSHSSSFSHGKQPRLSSLTPFWIKDPAPAPLTDTGAALGQAKRGLSVTVQRTRSTIAGKEL
jgi:hypothetical protein